MEKKSSLKSSGVNHISMQTPATTLCVAWFLTCFPPGSLPHISSDSRDGHPSALFWYAFWGAWKRIKKGNHGAFAWLFSRTWLGNEVREQWQVCKGLFLSIYCWTARREELRLPLLGCVYKLTPAGPGLICCKRKHLLQGVITPATSSHVSGNCTLLGRKPK